MLSGTDCILYLTIICRAKNQATLTTANNKTQEIVPQKNRFHAFFIARQRSSV